MKYKPGKELFIEDTLLRAFLPDSTGGFLDEEIEVNKLQNRIKTRSNQTGNTAGFITAATETRGAEWMA